MTIPIPAPGGQPPGVPPDVLNAWRSGEEKLYPVVMTRPDLYERSIRVVRQVADELGSCRDVAALVGSWPQAAEIVARAAAVALMSLDGLDVGLVAAASFSLRYRELAAVAARAERAERVRRAVEAGQPWVVVEQLGSPETVGLTPYSWVEMHTGGRGVAMRQTIEAELETGAPAFSLEVVMCDPVTGAVRPAAGDVTVAETFSDRAEWAAAVERTRRELEQA